jgi:hypothetical protein
MAPARNTHRPVHAVRGRNEIGAGAPHSFVALVEQARHANGIPVHAEYELRQIVRSYGESVEQLREPLGQDHVRGISAITYTSVR